MLGHLGEDDFIEPDHDLFMPCLAAASAQGKDRSDVVPGRRLYFASNCSGCQGDVDLWMATRCCQ
ncbi:MAG: hypothetical protein IPJ88_03275 [Myxococcales bacterium]|nr:MAG: hypothetical protein IPJ88_03275 [Myxococcales bacterium]